jgi:hypothetical protein
MPENYAMHIISLLFLVRTSKYYAQENGRLTRSHLRKRSNRVYKKKDFLELFFKESAHNNNRLTITTTNIIAPDPAFSGTKVVLPESITGLIHKEHTSPKIDLSARSIEHSQ